MVGRRAPDTLFQQTDRSEFLQCDAAPVCRRADGFQPAPALATVLVTEHSQLPGVVTPEPVRTQQPPVPSIYSRNGTPRGDCDPDYAVDILDRLNLRRDNSHPLTLPAPEGNLQVAQSFITQ